MMIKKQLGLLAGAVVAASSVNAATVGSNIQYGPGGNDSSVVVLLTDFGGTGTYALDVTAKTAVTQNDLLAGAGFTFTLSSAAQAWAGAATDLRYALFATSHENGTYFTSGGNLYGYNIGSPFPASTGCANSSGYCYNAESNTNPESYGLIYASTATSGLAGASGISATSNANNASGIIANLEAFNGDDESFNADGTAGDGDSNPAYNAIVNGLFEDAALVSNLYFLQADPGSGGATDENNWNPINGTGLLDSQLAQTAGLVSRREFVVSAVPVPAAAWLFGSALLGLGVVRRK